MTKISQKAEKEGYSTHLVENIQVLCKNVKMVIPTSLQILCSRMGPSLPTEPWD